MNIVMAHMGDMRGILVVGAGAREHAIMWGIAQGAPTVPLYAAPGNPGMAQLGECVPLEKRDDIVAWAKDKAPLLVVIGPEGPLSEGLSDVMRQDGHIVVGPSQEAAQLESSKAYAKRFMDRYHLPTASWEVFFDPQSLRRYLAGIPTWPVVLKQSRLAQGKGVVVALSPLMAEECVVQWSCDSGVFEEGVLVESCLVGREVSLQVLTNGSDCLWLPLAQDYKRLTAEENSPNTGGMGAYAPVDWLSPEQKNEIQTRILDPIMAGLQKEALMYRGVLYVGLMMTDDGPYILEFNVRMGDPETEVIIPIMPVNWIQWWWGLGQGIVPSEMPELTSSAVAVVAASAEYPQASSSKPRVAIEPIAGEGKTSVLFHAGTKMDNGTLVAAGGRVLVAVGVGETVAQAREFAYQQVQAITFTGRQFRGDISLRSS